MVFGLQNRLAVVYAALVDVLVRSRLLTLVVLLGVVLLLAQSLSLFKYIGFIFTEQIDLARITVKVEYPTYYNLEKTCERVKAIEDKLQDFPDLEYSLVTIGKVDGGITSATEGVFLGQIQLFFKDKTERDWTLSPVVKEIQARLKDETDGIITVSLLDYTGNQRLPLKINVMGSDIATLDKIGLRAQEILNTDPNITMTDTSVRDGKTEITVTPKREIMSDYNLSSLELGACLRANVDGIEIADYRRGDRTYDIRVKYKEIPGKNQVHDFTFPAGGKTLLLKSVADITEAFQPSKIYRREKTRAVSITADITQNGSLSEAIANVQDTLQKENLLPSDYRQEVAGDSEYMKEAITDFEEATIMAVFLTFLTLAAILESFASPIFIMLTLPLGLVGVMWSLFVTGHQISIFVFLGIVTLIGVVVNAAVLFIDKANNLRREGASGYEAMLLALRDQFTPVLMVTVASAIGMLPMAFASGIASELRVSIGIVSVGGVLFSGLVMMFVLPLVYILFTGGRNAKIKTK